MDIKTLATYSTNQKILGLKLKIAKVCPISFDWVEAGFEPNLLSRVIMSLICFTRAQKYSAIFDWLWAELQRSLTWVSSRTRLTLV